MGGGGVSYRGGGDRFGSIGKGGPSSRHGQGRRRRLEIRVAAQLDRASRVVRPVLVWEFL